MTRARHSRGAIAAFTLALVGAATLREAQAAKLLRTNTGAAVHWDAGSIVVDLDRKQASKGLPDRSVLLSIDEAAKSWNSLPEMRVGFVVPLEHAASPVAVTVRFCKGAWSYQAGLLANTTFTAAVDSGVVASAAILINECDYKFVGPEEVADGHFDLQAVLTHELGHVLGLAHTDELSAVMFENTGSVRQRRPTADDRAGIAAIYSPDGAPVLAAGPRGAAANAGPGVPSEPAPPARPGADPLVGDVPRGEDLPWPESGPPAPRAGAPGLKVAVTNKRAVPPAAAAPPAPPRKRTLPPSDVIHAVRLDGKDADGNSMMLYTIEPTLLPAFDLAPDRAGKPAKKSRAPGGAKKKPAAPPTTR